MAGSPLLVAVTLAVAVAVAQASGPIANAGPDVVMNGFSVQLSGAGSQHSGTSLTYQWVLQSRDPANSAAGTFSDATAVKPTFTVGNTGGTYTIKLTVTEQPSNIESTDEVVVYQPRVVVNTVASESYVEPTTGGPHAFNSVTFNTIGIPSTSIGSVFLADAEDGTVYGLVRNVATSDAGSPVSLDFSKVSGERDDVLLRVDFVTELPSIASATAYSNKFDLRRKKAWVPQAFGVCQMNDGGTCGMGFKTRMLQCTDLVASSNLPPSQCAFSAKPETTVSCYVTCPTSPIWVYGEWGSCSAECGDGIRTRPVYCVDSTGANSTTCTIVGKPADRGPCDLPACTTYSWSYGPWGECSASCGGGVQTRTSSCVDADGFPVSETLCLLSSREVVSRTCNDQTCGTNYWDTGAWSSCSASCGGGTSTRSVTCVGSPGDESACTSAATPKPATSRTCNSAACTVYAYQVSQWGACTTSCGGTRTRNVTCVNATASHIEVASSLCASLPKPSTSQPCNTCGFCKNRAEGNPNFNICTGRGECHANEDFCICDANYLGDFCHVSLGCNGVLDGNGECCEGILLADGACCKGESAVQDINGVCCNSGVVDACGVCEGPSLYVDARGECCTTKLDAQGICCAGDLDECGVCDGDGSTCVKRVALTFTLPASIPDGADLATITSPSFALLADDVAAFVQARTSTPGSVVERFEATPTARRLRLARRLAGYSVDAQVQLAQSISDTSVLVGTSGDITVVAVSALPAAGLCGNGVCELGEQCDAADTAKACCPDDCPLRQVSCPVGPGGECNGYGKCVSSADGSGVCECFLEMGYTGLACSTCADGFFHPTASASVCFRLAEATCTDGTRNGQETGIDCGDVCEIECVINEEVTVAIEPMWAVFIVSLVVLLLICCFLLLYPKYYRRKLQQPYEKANLNERSLRDFEVRRAAADEREAHNLSSRRGRSNDIKEQELPEVQFTGSNPMHANQPRPAAPAHAGNHK